MGKNRIVDEVWPFCLLCLPLWLLLLLPVEDFALSARRVCQCGCVCVCISALDILVLYYTFT